jgi:hypothetical protein
MFLRLYLRYPPGTHFMELKLVMHHRLGRPSADIKLFCSFVGRHSSVLNNQFPSRFFILCGCGTSAHTDIFKNFISLMNSSTKESIVPILSTHALIYPPDTPSIPTRNVSQIGAPPQCMSQVSLPCLPHRSNFHSNCKVNRLALPTGYVTPYNIPPALPFLPFSSEI